MKYVVTDLGAEPLAQKEKMKTLQPLKVWVSHPLVNNAFVINCYCLIIIIIISVISSDPPCNDGYARFTTAPLKAFPDQVTSQKQTLRVRKTTFSSTVLIRFTRVML